MIDMPFLDIGTLSKLVTATGEADSCHFRDEVFPCVFRLTPNLKTHLDTLYAESTERGGARSMQALLGQFDERILEKEDLPEKLFLNVNRPEDWSVIRDKISK